MKKILLITLICATSLVGCGSKDVSTNNNTITETTEDVSYDFRNSCWGDSMEAVKKSETLELLVEDEKLLVYSGGEIVNLDVTVIYGFDKDNKLIDGFYSVNEDHTNDNLYINDYEDIKESLSTKYGEPAYDDMVWNRDLYKDKQDSYGFAVSIGDLEYSSGWKIDNTYITLSLKGDNYNMNLSLIYQDGRSSKETDLSGL